MQTKDHEEEKQNKSATGENIEKEISYKKQHRKHYTCHLCGFRTHLARDFEQHHIKNHKPKYVKEKMSIVFHTELCSSEIQKFKEKIKSKTEFSEKCHFWKGSFNRDGYGIFRPMFRGKRITISVHRLVYFLNCEEKFLNPVYHVSHLCRIRCCVNFNHLSYESAAINVSRNKCKKDGTCSGHRGHKKCIFYA